MKIKNFVIGCCVVLAAFACEDSQDDHPVFKYYPVDDVFRSGFVNKYYVHLYPENSNGDASTKILYQKYQKLDNQHFIKEEYNAGFDLERRNYYKVLEDSIVNESGIEIKSFKVSDTLQLQLLDKTTSVWNGEKKTPFRIKFDQNDQSYFYTETQEFVLDSIIDGKKAKVFQTSWDYRYADKDSILNTGTSKSYYVADLGFYGSNSNGEGYYRQIELVEQMSLEVFEKRANHGLHRIAWIDPENTLSDDLEFQICGHEREIADYYNSTPKGNYIHGKSAMLDTINTHLDVTKFSGQTGRLVFRFVVNCDGEAGRFIAQGFDENYQSVVFEQSIIDHLFGILLRLEKWRPVVIRDEPRDAYFYITFNLAHGEIVDILP